MHSTRITLAGAGDGVLSLMDHAYPVKGTNGLQTEQAIRSARPTPRWNFIPGHSFRSAVDPNVKIPCLKAPNPSTSRDVDFHRRSALIWRAAKTWQNVRHDSKRSPAPRPALAPRRRMIGDRQNSIGVGVIQWQRES
jgi:hypothetical protein